MMSVRLAVVLSILLAAVPARAADREAEATQPVQFGPAQPVRGPLLPTLYVSLAALNAFDAYATSAGVSKGASEANPLMQHVAGSPTAMWAVKGAATATSIYFAERLWRKNQKVKAIAVMLAANGMMAAVAAHNAAVLRAQRAR